MVQGFQRWASCGFTRQLTGKANVERSQQLFAGYKSLLVPICIPARPSTSAKFSAFFRLSNFYRD